MNESSGITSATANASERFPHRMKRKRHKTVMKLCNDFETEGCDGSPSDRTKVCVASERFPHRMMRKRHKRAWVVFTGDTDLAWLRFLKPGFRHCFVLLHDGRHWVSVDPLSNYMEVLVHHLPPAFDLPAWLRDRGQHVVAAPLCRTVQCCAPLGVFSCVEAVKRILGLHNRFILTPWQLYRFLQHTRHCEAQSNEAIQKR